MPEVAGVILYYNWEMRLMEWLQSHISTSGIVFQILSNLSALGEQMILVVIMGFIYWGLNKEFGKYVGVNIVMVNIWNPMIKNIALRLRPYFVEEYNVKLLRLIDKGADPMDVAAQGYSFPSGHSSGAVTVYGSIAYHEKNKRWLWITAAVLSFLVGFSRVYVGAHYPTDVFFGWILGALTIAVVTLLRKYVKKSWLFNLILVLTTLPGFFYCKSNDYYTSMGLLFGFVLAEPFEQKFVNFENTDNILRCILRTIGGGIIYFGLNTILKMPFPKEVLDAGNFLAQMIRTLRYTVVVFTVVGVYPMLFKYTGKLWDKKKVEES